MKIFKDKDYWYGVYKSTVYPILLEKVESNDEKDVKWDNTVLDAIDMIIVKFFGPDDK